MIIYCPYTNTDIDLIKSSPEHIIPLSLGGSNSFEIPVCRDFNSHVGSKIDGAIANDFIVKLARGKVNARGHSNKKPITEINQAKCSDTGKPLKAIFEDNKFKLWSHIGRDYMRGNNTVDMKFQVKLDIELPFVAKVALSAGYFVYGDAFRNHVDHEALRSIMNNSQPETIEKKLEIDALVDERFNEPTEMPLKHFRQLCMAEDDSSIVGLVPHANRLAVFVGVLGNYLGMISVCANADSLSHLSNYKMGQMIRVRKGNLNRQSFFK